MDFNKLPNFLIIGAAKSGTTSLFNIVAQHPNVFSSQIKETRFFSDDQRFLRGVGWYQETHFKNIRNQAVRMEGTPAYLTWSEKVAPRIKELYGDHPVKFAVIFRDPVKRAYSHYWHRVRMGDEDPTKISFTDAIHSEDQRMRENWQRLEAEGNGLYGYYRAGCYASRLNPFLDLFPREKFYFMLQEDLSIENSVIMAGLFRFLGIDDEYPVKYLVSNESSVPRDERIYSIYHRLKKTGLNRIVKAFTPKKFRRWLREDALVKPIRYPPMDEDIKKELYSRYSYENQQLEKIIGRDLSKWNFLEKR